MHCRFPKSKSFVIQTKIKLLLLLILKNIFDFLKWCRIVRLCFYRYSSRILKVSNFMLVGASCVIVCLSCVFVRVSELCMSFVNNTVATTVNIIYNPLIFSRYTNRFKWFRGIERSILIKDKNTNK